MLQEAACRVSPVDKHSGWVGPGGLQVGHSIPLIDAALLWGDAALIESHPCESNASWEVVEPAWHLACLVEDLQGRPADAQSKEAFTIKKMDLEVEGAGSKVNLFIGSSDKWPAGGSAWTEQDS